MSTQETTMSGDVVEPKTASFVVSYAITVIVSSLIVVAKESNQGIHDWMTSITGHHWVTHGVFDILLFVVLGLLLAKNTSVSSMSGSGMVKTLVGSTVLSGLIIVGYFL